MRMMLTALALLWPALAQAQGPAFDPRAWKGTQAGPATEVLTLGSPHLSGLKPPYRTEYLEPLLDRLARYRPEVITIEAVSGEGCDTLERYRARYGSAFDDYCRGFREARAASTLSVADAMATAETMLAAWPAQPSAGDRRRLASLFLAAGDLASAQVQWRRLDASDRRAGDGLDAAQVAILQKQGARQNENMDIAAALAVRLGLERVYPVDDHSADAAVADQGEDYGRALQAIWSPAVMPPLRARFQAMESNLADPAGVLAFFRFLNEPATQRAFVTSDMGAALRAPSPQSFGRRYVGWYEARNLRMVANIREVIARQPGKRVLNIVGASHKAYYDAYLDMMHEVKLVDAGRLLAR